MKSTNAFTDLEHLQLVAGRIAQGGIDITREYEDWLKITFACASLGEAAREPYHDICRFYPGYTRQECDQKFDNCLRTGRGDITLGTLMELAKRNGIDVSLPKGRPPKTAEQKAEEEKDRFETIRKWLEERFEFRLNTISEQIEVRPKGDEILWKDMDDRQLDSLLTELHADKVYVSKANLETYIGSAMISPAYNPITAFAESLKPWNPRQKDYIKELFDHLGLTENEHHDFLIEMAKKWYVWLVAVATDQETSNQIMLILSGEQEGTGKTYFVQSFLPRPLRRYLHHVVELARYKDKDELLALARNIVCFIDEIQLNATTLNKLKNFVGGGAATAVTERTQYGHFAARRKVHASWISTTNREVFLPESSGDRRFVVLQIAKRGRDYKTLPQERAFAQAYYLATHPKAFSLEITPDEIEKLKEINQKYVQEDLCSVLIPTILRHPKEGDQVQAITNAEVIGWLNSRYGSNREFTPTKVGNAMKKCGFEKKKTNKGMRYFVVRVLMNGLENESKEIANQVLKPELPF
ncbi:MAG: PriCT-2 domain-containing protein [Paludibacteraceae bacterium]|nr:PriCT-2 domain-containing protein [Paludibacteraceae bacterium]